MDLEDGIYRVENGEFKRINLQSNQFEWLQNAVEETKNLSPIFGHVYLIENSNGYVKIGRSINPKTRIASILTQGNISAKNIFISPSHDLFYEVERTLHRIYENNRLLGEWFSISFYEAKQRIEKIFELI